MELSIAFLQLFSEMWSVGYRYASIEMPTSSASFATIYYIIFSKSTSIFAILCRFEEISQQIRLKMGSNFELWLIVAENTARIST